jgi:hypothetical protein
MRRHKYCCHRASVLGDSIGAMDGHDEHGPYALHHGVKLYPIARSAIAWATRDGWLASYGSNTHATTAAEADPRAWYVIDPAGKLFGALPSLALCAQAIGAATD